MQKKHKQTQIKKIKKMKKTLTILALSLTSVFNVNSQNKSSIAVSEPGIQGLYITPKMASKLMNIELTKNKLIPYDFF